jgi:hypothetical protein
VVVLPRDEPLVVPDVPAPTFWVLCGERQEPPERLPLRTLLDFAELRWIGGRDEHAPIRAFGEQHGPLGVRRITARTPAGDEVEGEPISAWLDAIRDVQDAVLALRMAGAFTLDPQHHEPETWEWLVAEGTLKGPRDKGHLVAEVRDQINAKLREHVLAPFTLSGDRLPLRFAPANDTLLAALWRRIAECAAGHSRIAFCEVCRQPLVSDGGLNRPGRRADARTCSVRCRVQKLRDQRRAKGRTARNSKPNRKVRKGGNR